MPPSTATCVSTPRLTVTTEYSVTSERPTTERPGSTISSRGGVEVCVQGVDGRLGVVGHRRRLVLRAVADAQPAAEVVGAEVAERGDRLGGPAEAVEVEQLRADVHVQPEQVERADWPDPLDQRRRRVDGDAELGLRAAGVHRRVRRSGHGRVDAQQHLLRRGRPGAPGGRRRRRCRSRSRRRRPPARRRCRGRSWRCRAAGCGQGRSRRRARWRARPPTRRRSPAPPRRGSASPARTAAPWRRSARRCAGDGRRTPPGTRARSRAATARRPRTPACRTPPRCRRARSRRSSDARRRSRPCAAACPSAKYRRAMIVPS